MSQHNLEQLRTRAQELRLNGLLEHWAEVGTADWVAPLIQWEEEERARRSQHHSTIVTPNRPFAEWSEVFPTAACVVSLVDRLMHRAEVIAVDGESDRLKEARDRCEARAKQRSAKKAVREGASS